MTDERLPPPPPPTASNGEAGYYRRRIDELVDRRLEGIEEAIGELRSDQVRLGGRLNYLFGALAVISVLANLVGPAIFEAITGK